MRVQRGRMKWKIKKLILKNSPKYAFWYVLKLKKYRIIKASSIPKGVQQGV